MLTTLFPVFYGLAALLLLWQAFRVMAKGFRAAGGNSTVHSANSQKATGDRTGRLTVHPELLDQEGRITDEDLLTVRFSGDNEVSPSDETSAE